MASFLGNETVAARPASSAWLLPLTATLLATALSFLSTGYVPLSSNNIYHLPILSALYDLPQFAGDEFIQSLRHFSSGFWLIFAGTSGIIEPRLLLGTWLVITHFLFLASSLHLARALGYRDPWLLSAFVLILSLSALATGEAAGGGALMIESFTHSELANASLMAALAFALSQRYGWSVAMVSLTFFLNAFMAVWVAVPILFVVAHHVETGQTTLKAALRSALPGLAGLVLVAPVLINIIGNSEGLDTTGFSYRDFLWSYYPEHFFISAVPAGELIEMAGLTVVLLLTLAHHGRGTPGLAAIAAGAFAVLALGLVVPHVTDSRSILNLHLIRSFVVVHWLAVISLVLAAVSMIWPGSRGRNPALGLILIGLLLLPRPLWLLAVPLLLVDRLLPGLINCIPKRLAMMASLVFLALCVAAVPVRVDRKLGFTHDRIARTGHWEALGQWARDNTAPESTFLVAPDLGPGESALGFGRTAERQIWTSLKYGAAVMWQPSYFTTWTERRPAVDFANDVNAMLAYAGKHGISHVAAACAPGLTAIHQQDGLCLYTARSNG